MELNPIDIPGVKSQLLMFYVISSKNVTTVSWLLFNLNILSIIFKDQVVSVSTEPGFYI
jgi:hypothetical protein